MAGQREAAARSEAGRRVLRGGDGDASTTSAWQHRSGRCRSRSSMRSPSSRIASHASYDRAQVENFWRALVQMNRVFEVFRSEFVGKVSPVHLFWGALDLAVTRFSGRTAPPHPGGAPNCGPHVMHEAYSHEVSSAGYWPGPDGEGVFYSYAYPEPDGYRTHPVTPAQALDERARRVRPPVRDRSHGARRRRRAARLPPGELRRRCRSRCLGPGRPRAPVQRVDLVTQVLDIENVGDQIADRDAE